MKSSFDRLTKPLEKILKLSEGQLLTSLRPAIDSDIPNLVAFRKTFFPAGLKWDDEIYLRWRYDFSDTQTKESSHYWILTINDKIIGSIGAEKFGLMIEGNVKMACHPLDLMISPDHDGMGIGAWLALALKEKCPLMFVMGASDQARSLVKRIFTPLPNCIEWKLPISIEGSLARRIKSSFLAKLAAMLVDNIIAIPRNIRFKNIALKSVSVKKIVRFTGDVNQFGNAPRSVKIFRNRSSDYLNWRFIDNPCTQYTALGLYDDSKLIAYTIHHVTYSALNRQYEAQIDDIFWLTKRPNEDKYALVKWALAATINHAKNRGAKLVQITAHSTDLEYVMRSMGFIQRGASVVCAVYAEDESLLELLQAKNLWFITGGDSHQEDYQTDGQRPLSC